jgi:hypothetical protein
VATGCWRVLVSGVDVTKFRGAPTRVDSLTTTDPFGPAAAGLTFPAVTVLDKIGTGDLEWLRPEADVDIVFTGEGPGAYGAWAGYLASFDYAEEGPNVVLSVSCKGAMTQADNYLAKPEYLYRPIPYERAIARQFEDRLDLRLAPMRVEWPSWWTAKFNSSDRNYANRPWMVPEEVANGALWSAMVTRETGSWEPVLTGYVQGLLANMWTDRGQFTLVLDAGRIPVLRHRDHLTQPDASTLVVDVMHPGVKVTPSMDYTQRIGAVYVQGRSLNGDTYTGMQVSADGTSTWYQPAAASRLVHPGEAEYNEWLDLSVMRREVMLSFSEGLTYEEAQAAALRHQQRFATPGVTANITLTSDPLREGVLFPRQGITAGMSIQARSLLGRADGVLFHITECSQSHDGTVSLTVDSLYRDQLTVDQVRKRGRDSLTIARTLSTSGTYSPKIPDLLFPWSYANGSGAMPFGMHTIVGKLGPEAVSKDPAGYKGDPYEVPFPWEEYTTRFPPSSHSSKYIAIGPKDDIANMNWANVKRRGAKSDAANLSAFKAYPVRLSAKGEIRLVQFAAYDRTGHVKKVPFHVSLYYQSGVSYTHMPKIPTDAYRKITTAATVAVKQGSKTVTVTKLPRGHGLGVGEYVGIDSKGAADPLGVDGEWPVLTSSTTSITFELAANWTAAAASVTATVSERYSKNGAYSAGQYYPFFPEAWERVLPTGQIPGFVKQVGVNDTATLIAGWGTGFEKAGFWPRSSLGKTDADATGLLVDETGFSYDFTGRDSGVNQYNSQAKNMKTPDRITAFVMVYCDADAVAGTYFMGRMYRKETLS